MAEDARQHLSDAQLLEHADGELSAGADQAVARHLDACWTCRARFDELEQVIRAVAKFRNDVLLPSAPDPPRPWPGLEPALSSLETRREMPSFLGRLQRMLRSGRLGGRPAWGWALGALALAIGFAAFGLRRGHMSPETLLEQAGAAERAAVDAPAKALRRVVQLEERRGADPSIVGRRRIETWWRGPLVARRVFDERERLIAGEWTNADGSRTVYRSGQPPEVLPASARPGLEERDIWRLDPSARDFLVLVGRSSHTTVEPRPDGYVVRYRPPGVQGSAGPALVEARLTIRKDGLRVTDQVLVVLEAEVMREYRFVERTREQMPAARVHPAAFVPEPQLAGAPVTILRPARAARPVRLSAPPLSEAALDAMETAAWQRLHQAGLCASERATVSRTAEGVDVRVAVENETRRDAIRNLLGGFGLPPAIRVDLTVSPEASPPPIRAPQDRAAAHELLRVYLAGQVARWSGEAEHRPRQTADEAALDAAAGQMAAWAVQRSTRVVDQARALQREAARRPSSRSGRLDLDAVSAWQSMITDHAREILAEVELLQGQFGPVLFPAGPPREAREDVPVQDVADVEAAAAGMLDLATRQHAAVDAAFAPAPPHARREPVDGKAVWRMWRALDDQARRFTAPWVLLRPRTSSKE
jgi:hypothetical protein